MTEAGGKVTDSRGEFLDFGLGRNLGENYGVIAAGNSIPPGGKSAHDELLSAVQATLKEEQQQRAKV